MIEKKYIVVIIGVCSFLLFVIINTPTPVKVQGDGIFYYGWATSVIFDHDIDLTNQLKQTYHYDFYSKHFIDNNIITQTNHVPNPYAFGVALLWAPFIILINIVHFMLSIFNVELHTKNGYSNIYIFAINFATWIWGSVAIIVIYKTLRYYFNKYISTITALAIWLATPFVYYHFFEPSMAHTASILLTSTFLWYTIKSVKKQKISYTFFGIVIFLMIATRWQNILFLIAILPFFIHYFSKQTTIRLLGTISFVVAFFFLLQMFVWEKLYGTYLLIPQGDKFIGSSFHFLQTLFSSNRGLFFWSPVLMLSLGGLYFLYKKEKYLTYVCITAFCLQWVINSMLSDNGGGDAFGGRRFISTLPFFAIMLGALLEKQKYTKIIVALIIMMITWNMFLIDNYRKNNIPHSGTFDIRSINF